MLLQKADLRQREHQRERHDAEDFEATQVSVEKLRQINLVEDGEKHEEQRPAQRQDAPAFFGKPQHLAEDDLQKQPAAKQSAKQIAAKRPFTIVGLILMK